MNYIIYDTDGTILKNVSCPEDMIALQVKPGQQFMQVAERLDDRKFCVKAKKIEATNFVPKIRPVRESLESRLAKLEQQVTVLKETLNAQKAKG